MPTLFDPLQVGDLRAAQSHFHGAAHAAAFRRYARAQRADGEVLRAARFGGADPFRGDECHADGCRLCRYAGHLVAGAGRKAGSRSRTPFIAPAGTSSCSCGTWVASRTRLFLDGATPVAPSAIGPRGV